MPIFARGKLPQSPQTGEFSPYLMLHRCPILLPLVFATSMLAQSALHGADSDPSWFSRKSSWNGHDQYHFQISGRNAYIVAPLKPQAGNPWIWRARFPGYHAEMDIQLVKKGYHIGYVDVAGLFGSDRSIAIAEQFYDFVTRNRKLNAKPAMEGVSRGGLFVYNWTAKYPQRVSCIYCDTPVCDFRSWPGGKGKGIGSAGAWQQCLKAYGISENEAAAYDRMPVDHAKIIAAAKIPVLHIVSENDRVVPPNENTYRLRDAVVSHGHKMEIISVAIGTQKSNGHHFDHPDPQRVIEFITRHHH